MKPNDENDTITRLSDAAEKVINRTAYEQGNRRSLLWVHSAMGMLAGVQMVLWGSASVIETSVGVWIRPWLAGLGILGGLALAFGLARRPRNIAGEIIGLTLIGLWDLLMATGLTVARIQQNDYHLIPLGQALRQGYVVAYPTTIYGGLFALVVIHLTTLFRLRRAKR